MQKRFNLLLEGLLTQRSCRVQHVLHLSPVNNYFVPFFWDGHFFQSQTESGAHSPVKNSERCLSDRHFTGSSTKPRWGHTEPRWVTRWPSPWRFARVLQGTWFRIDDPIQELVSVDGDICHQKNASFLGVNASKPNRNIPINQSTKMCRPANFLKKKEKKNTSSLTSWSPTL